MTGGAGRSVKLRFRRKKIENEPCFSVRYKVWEKTSIGLLIIVAEEMVSNTFPTYFFSTNLSLKMIGQKCKNTNLKSVPCC